MGLIDNILHRLKFSKFLMVVFEELDKESFSRVCCNMEGFHCNKCLTEPWILKTRLVTACFVECCPDPEPVLTESTLEETTAKKKGEKSAKYHQKIEESKSLELR
ncbi:uncharacterized protein LOC119985283 isoform X2 [Tripterygium wilfordii]|uniref:uncharacterized protein LOC119985283 isoform X2 n=1 Tax=Tripterygium wilfordii TaxID=458696 RepID=UPI0018F81A04|nr:uncharacterized protein LOC119985283 isoform X2 [Tripterygium wilfordii]